MSDVATSGSVSSACGISAPERVDHIPLEKEASYITLENYTQSFQSYENITLGHGFSDSKDAIRYHTRRMKKQLKELNEKLMM